MNYKELVKVIDGAVVTYLVSADMGDYIEILGRINKEPDESEEEMKRNFVRKRLEVAAKHLGWEAVTEEQVERSMKRYYFEKL